jgi:hypothetical protein
MEAGWRVLVQQPILAIGKQVTFAWSGAAFVLMVLAFYEWLPIELRSYSAKAATIMGLIAGATFLVAGLVGGFASSDLSYLQSVHAGESTTMAYLPLTLITNRGLAAAITISGFWFVLINWTLRQHATLPQSLSYLGLGIGIIAISGLVQPGADYGLLALPVAALWAILIGIWMLRVRREG